MLVYFVVVGGVLAVILIARSLSNILQNQQASIEVPSVVKPVPLQLSSESKADAVSTPSLGYERHQSISRNSLVRRNEKPVRIAYIFAGSVRSLLCPKVHWSIRLHLLDALGGESYSFVRLSTEDNKNTNTGDGIIYSPGHDLRELNATLRVLNPKAVEYFQLSSQDIEMERNYPSLTGLSQNGSTPLFHVLSSLYGISFGEAV
jgi:hypothetical protein